MIPNAQFHSLLGLRSNAASSVLTAHGPPLITIESNTDRFDDPQEYSLPTLLENCRALAYTADPENQRKGREAIPEPGWVALVQTVRLVRNGIKAVHLVSSQDPRYQEGYVNGRLASWDQQGFKGPATCEQIQKAYSQHYNADCCNGCPSKGIVKTPLVLAKYFELIPEIVVPDAVKGDYIAPELPDSYVRTKQGIGIATASKSGINEIVTFCPYDMHPIGLRYDEGSRIEEDVVWRVKFPHEGWMDIGIPQVTKAYLQVTLAKRGIHLFEHSMNLQQNFMNAYVQKLQHDLPREMSFNKLGWRNDGDFVLGETLYRKNGTTEEHAMGVGLTNATHQGIRVAGSYEEWKRGVSLYGRDGLEPYRVYFMSGFASILYKFTGLVATAINASGRTGLGKSTLMEVSGSIWGEPDSLKVHGDTDSSTKAGAEGLINAMNNLPVFMDEITMRDPKQVAQLIFTYSGGKGKIRSTINGGVRGDTATWSNFLMMNANNDEYERFASLFRESAQHIVRLIQIPFQPSDIITKAEGDLLRRCVHENYGWAGRIFVEFVVTHQPQVKKRIQQLIVSTDKAVKALPEERFWTGWVACVQVAYEICINLAITPWLTTKTDIPWMYKQIDLMRHTATSHVPVASEVISEFLDASLNGTLTIGAVGASNIHDMRDQPNRELIVRKETDTGFIYISKTAFRKYCIEKSINFHRVVTDMIQRKILCREDMHKTLGAGTHYESGRIRCMEIDSAVLASITGTP